MAVITLVGLYNYDNTIFDDMKLPSELDFDTVKNAILLNCSEFEVLYPNPDAMKTAIEYWSQSKLHSWQKITNALYKDYNPFINFTRDEKREIISNYNNEGVGKYSAWNEQELQTRDGSETQGESSTVETFHSEGDSALFTPTDVARKEAELRLTFDMLDIIINDFKVNLVLAIY